MSGEKVSGYVAYDPAYPDRFTRERARLQLFLYDDWTIDHIGSTAVPGLGGKPIIDIAICAPDDQLEAACMLLMLAGYTLEKGVKVAAGTAVLRRQDAAGRHFQVLLNADGSPNVVDAIRLRNYLRAHHADRDLYDALKRRSALPKDSARNERPSRFE